ncbi:hypothetical protein B0H19DRAFT_249296 [Mycena capillaripes]|nr:hypothetical protein B0H19DRAFT_249296 [Mycena capillaripes]
MAKPADLTHFTITVEPIPSTVDALFLIDSTLLVKSTLHFFQSLKHWYDLVISRVTKVLPRCRGKEVEISYNEGGPFEVFSFYLFPTRLEPISRLNSLS